MASILESEYVEPERPYSQNELKYNRERLYRSLRLGKIRAHHRRCDHFYFVRRNGRKEKEIEETGSADTGNCSVCWKLGKTPNRLRSEATGLVEQYSRAFYEEPEYTTYGRLDLETIFYRWLYEEQERDRSRRRDTPYDD